MLGLQGLAQSGTSIVTACVLSACGTPRDRVLAARLPLLSSEGTVLDTCAPARSVRVACAVDGDTLDLDTCGQGERIRALGMDTPELAHDGAPADCGADPATQALAAFAGDAVTLSFDRRCTDAFGRTLAWVWLDPASVDAVLGPEITAQTQALWDAPPDADVLLPAAFLRAGLARRYVGPAAEPTRFDTALLQAERAARSELSGLWGSCDSPDGSSR